MIAIKKVLENVGSILRVDIETGGKSFYDFYKKNEFDKLVEDIKAFYDRGQVAVDDRSYSIVQQFHEVG
jgi:Fe-S cluster assembly iron-binding protein IscA